MQTAFVKPSLRAVALILVASACATQAPQVDSISSSERSQRDRSLGVEVARQFDAQSKFKRDPGVISYLIDLARKVGSSSPEIRSLPVEIFLLQDRGSVWRDYGIPGRIYLSTSLLKRFEFENQIAAAIAFELAHLQRRHLVLRVQEEALRAQKRSEQLDSTEASPNAAVAKGAAGWLSTDYPSIAGLVTSASSRENRPLEYFGPDGIFEFPEEYHLGAVDTAVEMLYSSGYDPRGLASLWSLYLGNPKNSPFSGELLEKLLEKTRRVIALHAPLRNPIVRSQTFLAIQKRIQNL